MRGTIYERFNAGEHDAMAEIFRLHAGAVTTVARSMLWSDDLVADAVQQTFVKAWRSRADYDPTRPFAPWIYAIARRASIDILRKERRRSGPRLDDIDPGEPGPAFEVVWEVFEVRAAVDALPEDEREVVRLQHLEGYTHRQIAGRLGIPIGTVKSRSHRAHGRLTEALGHLVGEPIDTRYRMEER